MKFYTEYSASVNIYKACGATAYLWLLFIYGKLTDDTGKLTGENGAPAS